MNKIKFIFLGIIITVVLSFISFKGTFALFSSTATSQNNTFAAAQVFPTATPSATPTPTGVQPGNVVINEIMWMGTQGDAADEWIELRNMTGSTIDLSGWVVTNLGTSGDITIPAGKSIGPSGFFMIANDSKADGNHDVDPDVVVNISLNNTGEQLILKTSVAGTTIDTGNGTGAWLAGVDPGGLNPERSMERNNIPGDGTQATNWHTATSAANMDIGAREIATPKAINSTP